MLSDMLEGTTSNLESFRTFVSETNTMTTNNINWIQDLTGQVMDNHMNLFSQVTTFLRNLSRVGTRSIMTRNINEVVEEEDTVEPELTIAEKFNKLFPSYGVLLNYINSVIKDKNISFEGTEKNNDLLITFTVAEIFRQLCSINDNLTSFTKIPDDHDLKINEEPE